MYAARYFAPRYFAPRYWAKVGDVLPVIVAGARRCLSIGISLYS